MAEKGLVVRIVLRFISGLIFIGALLFGTAGTFNWPEAWVYLVIQFGWSVGLSIFLWRHDIELLKDRMKFTKKSAKGWDKVMTFVSMPFYIPYLVLPGLDAVRYQWSHVPLWAKVACFIVIVASFLWISWIMKENTYLSRFVEIQEDRGHKVITTGPYKFVRHPMYISASILMIALPIALGSLYALIPMAFITVFIIIRTYLEDKTLHKELEGYVEYAKITRYRLIPGVW